MKVIIAGSRDIDDIDVLHDAYGRCRWSITEIVSGGARGVDTMARDFAIYNTISYKEFLPDWDIGRHAGFIRNDQMAQYAEGLIAIWDGKSKGTKHMIDTMLNYHKPTYIHFV
jgi:hypothetical protein